MPLHPQAQAVLDTFGGLGLPNGLDAFLTMSAQDARAMMEQFRVPLEPEPVATVFDRTIPGPNGDIPVRVYNPGGGDALPALLWFHGGGWVIGSVEGSDPTARALANQSGAVVISVDYHLAPEYKFPAPAEDCYAATRYVAEHPGEFGIDPARIAVGGDSAGGNLAAVVAIMARERGGPRIAFQALVYPVTDYNLDSESYRANANGYLLTVGSMRWFWDHYLNHPDEGKNHHASPLRTPSLAGLPPAIVITAEYDPLCSEGEAYAARLREAGVPTEHRRYEGQIHGFFGMAATMDDAKAAVTQVSSALKAALAG